MAQKNMKQYNGRFCESDFENAFISFLEHEGWIYLSGDNIARTNKKEVIIDCDMIAYIFHQFSLVSPVQDNRGAYLVSGRKSDGPFGAPEHFVPVSEFQYHPEYGQYVPDGFSSESFVHLLQGEFLYFIFHDAASVPEMWNDVVPDDQRVSRNRRQFHISFPVILPQLCCFSDSFASCHNCSICDF